MLLRFLCAEDGNLLISAVEPQDGSSQFPVFRVRRNDEPGSIATRIVTQFTGQSAPWEFESRETSRRRVDAAIDHAWPSCISETSDPDTVVDLYFSDDGLSGWTIQHESELYHRYTEELLPLPSLLEDVESETITAIDPSALTVKLSCTPNTLSGDTVGKISSPDGSCHIHKQVCFLDALESWDKFIMNKQLLYQLIRTLHQLPPHSNILPPPTELTVTNNLVTGVLIPDYPSLDSHLETAVSLSQPISLLQKAKWFSDLSSALLHAHTSHAHTLTLHPTTIAIHPATSALLLTDFASASAHPSTLAPEADATWTLAGPDPDTAQLVYTPYAGPLRQNIPGWPYWDVFPEWREKWPRAAEAATVYAAGRTIALVLDYGREEVDDENDENDRDETKDDAPHRWREMVGMCVDEDPNRRIRLADLARFWEREVVRITGEGTRT